MKKILISLLSAAALSAACIVPVSAMEPAPDTPLDPQPEVHTHQYVYIDSGDGFMHHVSCADETCEEALSPAPHTGGAATCTEPAYCQDCGAGYGEPDGHSGGGTCIEEWYCEICEQVVGEKDPDSHIYGYDTVDAAEPTCEAEGYTGDTVCSACGELIEEGEVIAKLPHTYGSGECTGCGTAQPGWEPAPEPEEPEPEPVVPPEEEQPETEPGPQPEPQPKVQPEDDYEVPKTGDTTVSPFLWAGIGTAAAGVGAVIAVLLRKRAKQ